MTNQESKAAGFAKWLFDKASSALMGSFFSIALGSVIGGGAMYALVANGFVNVGAGLTGVHEIVKENRDELSKTRAALDEVDNVLHALAEKANGIDEIVRDLTRQTRRVQASIEEATYERSTATTEVIAAVTGSTITIGAKIDAAKNETNRLINKETHGILRAIQDGNHTISEKIADLSSLEMAPQLALEKVMCRLVDDGIALLGGLRDPASKPDCPEGRTAAGGSNNVERGAEIAEWMDRALYIITSLDLQKVEGFVRDRSTVHSDLAKAVSQFKKNGDVGHARSALGIVRAVQELVSAHRIQP